MITFLCIFFIPVIVLGIPGILIIGQRSRAAAEARLAGQFEQTYSNVQRMFSEMDSFAREMEKTQMVYALTYMQDTSQIHTRYSAIDYHAFAYQLMISMINNDSFDDLAILFPQINFGLTQRGEYQMDQILMNEFHVGDLDANAWKEVLQDSVGSHVLLLNRQMQTFEVVRSGTVYLYCPRPSFGNDPRLAFLFFLSEGGLRSRFQKIGLNQMVNVYISKDNATQTLLAAASEAEGKVYTLSGALNDIGATLTLTIPESVLYEDWHTLRQALFLFLLLIMLVGSLVTVLAATINYKPLEHLFSVLFSSGILHI